MKRKCYESYDYIDPDNLYTYPGSSVLRNKQEERDEKKQASWNIVWLLVRV